MSLENTKQHGSSIKQYLIRAVWIVVLAGVGRFISEAIKQYNETGGDEGIFICNEEECFKTVHIHSDITFDLCGNDADLTREKGDLSGLHTHKEKNYLHFHDRLELDAESAQGVENKTTDSYDQLEDERLSIEKVLATYEKELDPVKHCGTDDITIHIEVNGERLDDYSTYNRNDGDLLKLIYVKN